MANFKKSGFIVRNGVRRRQTLWLASTSIETAISAGTAVLLSSLNAAALALRPFTVVRTRGHLFVAFDQTANTENQTVNFGSIVVTSEAVAIGVTAIPTPVSESAFDWFVFETLMGRLGVSSATSVFQMGVGKDFDSKAMRKVDIGEDLIQVVESNATGISEGVAFRNFARFLIKLH